MKTSEIIAQIKAKLVEMNFNHNVAFEFPLKDKQPATTPVDAGRPLYLTNNSENYNVTEITPEAAAKLKDAHLSTYIRKTQALNGSWTWAPIFVYQLATENMRAYSPSTEHSPTSATTPPTPATPEREFDAGRVKDVYAYSRLPTHG